MAPVKSFTIDDSLWPFLMIQMRGRPTSEEYAEYLQASTTYLERGEPHLVVLDMLQAGFSTTEQIHQQAEWNMKHEVRLRKLLLGSGFAMATSFVRLGLNVVFYLCPPAAPYLITARLELAISWGAQRLEEVGLEQCAQRVRQRYSPCAASFHFG